MQHDSDRAPGAHADASSDGDGYARPADGHRDGNCDADRYADADTLRVHSLRPLCLFNAGADVHAHPYANGDFLPHASRLRV